MQHILLVGVALYFSIRRNSFEENVSRHYRLKFNLQGFSRKLQRPFSVFKNQSQA